MPEDPLPLYLLGRRLVIEQRSPEAIRPLGTALGLLDKSEYALPTSTARLVAAAIHQLRGVALLEVGDTEAAAQCFETLAAQTSWPGRSLKFSEWAERARWHTPGSLTL